MSFNDPAEALFNEANKSMANAAISAVKQIAAMLRGLLLRGVAVFSDPLFRKNLGERYLSPAVLLGMWVIWALALALSWWYGTFVAQSILLYFRMPGMALAISRAYWLSMAVVLAYGLALRFLVIKDLKAAVLRHFDGRPTHSYSYGEPRFGIQTEGGLKLGLFVFFFLVSMPLAVAYLASLYFSYLAGKLQEAELYGRYLDAIDAMIETEQLETALLGVTPVSNTQLIKPLSANLPDSLRKNIAAAAARNTVTGLAKPPKAAAINPGTSAPTSA